MTAPGWSDDDATLPKPTDPCRCGTYAWAWFKPGLRWSCAICGRLAKMPRAGARHAADGAAIQTGELLEAHGLATGDLNNRACSNTYEVETRLL